MQARSTETGKTGERRAAMLGRAGILTAAVLAGGCAQIIGVEDLPPLEFAVRGSAAGLLGPVALELRLGGDVELLAVTQDGTFAFETRLEAGASYTVVFADSTTPCTLRNQTGVIANADASIELLCASLESVVVSGPAPPAILLVAGTTDYVVDVSLLQQSVMLTASVATPGDTLTIAGAPVISGAPSAEITLSLGDNPVDIVVENALGWQRTYRLTLRRAAELAQYAYGKASNTDADDQFGYSVALSGDTLAVSAAYEDSAAQGVGGNQDDNSATDSGAVYIFRRSGTAWLQEAYLKASNTGTDDFFGRSVALSGDTLAVGAQHEDSAAQGVDGNQDDNSATDSGAVYIFRRSGTAWLQEAYLKASNTGAGDSFGTSVALSGDTLAVGAQHEDSAAQGVDGNQDDNSATGSGAVYVFRRSDTAWLQEAYLKASNTGALDFFGFSVALSGDTLVIGAYQEDSMAQGVDGNQADNTASNSGAAYVFRRSGTAWLQEAYLKASNTDAADRFGLSVALSGDTLAVGAQHEDSAAQSVDGNQDDNSATDSGAVYIFRRSGTAWLQEAYLKATNTSAGDSFASVALSGDTLAVGAVYEDSAAQGVDGNQDDDSAADSGAVYIFRRSGTAWLQEAYLKASSTSPGDYFGARVALSGDTLAVGTWAEDSAAKGVGGNQDDDTASNSGAIYVFH
jgi:hypothetical protein